MDRDEPLDQGVDATPQDDADEGGLLRLGLIAVIAGVVVGVIGSAFRIVLAAANLVRGDLLDWTREAPALRWLVPVLLAAVAAGLARLVVRWVPTAAGSGIQRVEAAVRQETPDTPWQVLPAKFVGGVLALGAGLALGREGPSVQMGAAVGSQAGRLGKVDGHDRRVLEAALSGAGLGVAFSAPLGGAMFVFEEVSRAIRTRLVIATLAGTAAAIAVTHAMIGSQPVFVLPDVESGSWWLLVAYAVLGLVLGLLGPLYSRLTLWCLDLFERMTAVPPELMAAAVGALVGVLGVIDPTLVGSGEALNEAVLLGRYAAGAVAVMLVVRWFLGPVSYAPGTPGGLFAPLLLVGALAGTLLAEAANAVIPALDLPVTAMAIVGMSTFFAAVVRAPITGIILVIEMTATASLVGPMVVAAAVAVLIPTMLHSAPVYEALRLRLLERP